MRKIEAMHNQYGLIENKCKYCCNFCSYTANKTWYKCKAYGISNSEATDWAKSNVACGRFNIPFDEEKEVPLLEKIKHSHSAMVDFPIDGQIEIAEWGKK